MTKTNMFLAVATMLTQEEAVFQAITNVCEAIDGRFEPTREQRAQVTEILVEGFKAGKIALKDTPSNREKLADDAKLRSYCSGLQSNWLRKDERLNGGVKYVPKNPGSRTGSTDPQVKAMRNLLAVKGPSLSAEERAQIQGLIDARVAEIRPTKSVELTEEQIAILEASGLGHFVA